MLQEVDGNIKSMVIGNMFQVKLDQGHENLRQVTRNSLNINLVLTK